MATPCDGPTLVLVFGDDERKQIETIGLGRFGTHREYDVDPETMIMMEVRPLRSEAGCGRRTSRSSSDQKRARRRSSIAVGISSLSSVETPLGVATACRRTDPPLSATAGIARPRGQIASVA